MQISTLSAALLAAAMAAAPGLAQAAGTLTLVIGGEGFDGPPKFAVSFDGKPLGDGAIASAIDTATTGRFADAADKAKYVQHFSFTIPDALFKPDGEVRVRLTNEAHGTQRPLHDRQLYLASVAVNGAEQATGGFSMRSNVGVEPTALLGPYLVIAQTQIEAVVAPPAGGWPKAVAPVASASPKPAEAKPAEPAAPAVASAPVADKPASPPESKPAEVATTAAPASKPDAAPIAPPAADMQVANASPTPLPKATPVRADSGNPNPEAGSPACGVSKSFQILGFNANSNDLTPRVYRQLDRVVEALGGQKCVVHLTGYSSTEGNFAENALFSIERAQNALHYLAGKGVKFRRYSANGVGETTQFGADPNANRRVVVTVSP